jgi:hypothetical protein
MEEPDIRHVRFFNGQFLQQDEFRLEQGYANHMRRRMNYVLLTDGVIEVTPDDLTIQRVDPTSAANKRIRVRSGMAVAGYRLLREGKEIIRRNDLPEYDLTTFGGGTVWVTVNYRREEQEPVTVAAVLQNSRVEESSEVRLHAARPAPGTATPEGEVMVVIGSVNFGTMEPSRDDRQIARLRSALLAPVAGITLNPASVVAGTNNFETTIGAVGFDMSTLVAADITFSDPANISPIPVTIVTGPTVSSVRIRFNMGGTLGSVRQVRVTVGSVTHSAPLTVQAFVGPPTIGVPVPNPPRRANPLTIPGTNFINVTSVNFTGATNVAHTVVSPTEILVPDVPGTAQAGPMSITAQGGTATRNVGMTS